MNQSECRLRQALRCKAKTVRHVLPLFMPRIEPTPTYDCCEMLCQESFMDHFKDFHPFSLHHVAWAAQQGLSAECVERYLNKFDEKDVAEALKTPLIVKTEAKNLRIPIVVFAIERNSTSLVRLLCRAGASPNDKIKPCKIPVLAYAIFHSEYGIMDTTDVVIQLLVMGAQPNHIPEDMWQDPLQAPQREQAKPNPDISKWCRPEVREALARTFNLMQRYCLRKASTLSIPSPRALQIAKATATVPLFEVPYHVIGQHEPTQTVIDSILNLYMSDGNRPLILLLTGPSGHGKTELAKRMGSFLSLNSVFVDCARMKHETDIFGPQAPYQGWEEGCPLNNHLVEHAGQRNIVFLDEFDKTTKEVHKAMLLLFEHGWYHDRRHANEPIDCNKTIWILAANIGVPTISRFFSDSFHGTIDRKKRADLYSQLQRLVGKEVMKKLGHPLFGRISATIPFLPFDGVEQAVAAFKFMRQYRIDKRGPIDVKGKNFFNHCCIDYVDDGQLCSHLASEYYQSETGARSLEHAVEDRIMVPAGACFRSGDGLITDQMNEGPLERYEVRLITEGELQPDIRVIRAGDVSIQRGEEEMASKQSSGEDNGVPLYEQESATMFE